LLAYMSLLKLLLGLRCCILICATWVGVELNKPSSSKVVAQFIHMLSLSFT
jgi:hypothetical protein